MAGARRRCETAKSESSSSSRSRRLWLSATEISEERTQGGRAPGPPVPETRAGAAALVLPWMALGAWMPHLPGSVLAGQAGFVRYFTMADWQPAIKAADLKP